MKAWAVTLSALVVLVVLVALGTVFWWATGTYVRSEVSEPAGPGILRSIDRCQNLSVHGGCSTDNFFELKDQRWAVQDVRLDPNGEWIYLNVDKESLAGLFVEVKSVREAGSLTQNLLDRGPDWAEITPEDWCGSPSSFFYLTDLYDPYFHHPVHIGTTKLSRAYPKDGHFETEIIFQTESDLQKWRIAGLDTACGRDGAFYYVLLGLPAGWLKKTPEQLRAVFTDESYERRFEQAFVETPGAVELHSWSPQKGHRLVAQWDWTRIKPDPRNPAGESLNAFYFDQSGSVFRWCVSRVKDGYCTNIPAM